VVRLGSSTPTTVRGMWQSTQAEPDRPASWNVCARAAAGSLSPAWHVRHTSPVRAAGFISERPPRPCGGACT